jgi:hypothetical protein
MAGSGRVVARLRRPVVIDRTNVYLRQRTVKSEAASASGRIDVRPSKWCTSCRLSLHSVGSFLAVAAAPDVKRSVVLILSEDPLAAALIGAAVELVGFEPTFPTDGESPRDALLRERPGLVLVDCDHEAACGPSFFGPVLMTGARGLLVGSRRTRRDVTELAAEFGLRALTLPAKLETIADLMRAELEAAGR